jgi:hypothetical protein
MWINAESDKPPVGQRVLLLPKTGGPFIGSWVNDSDWGECWQVDDSSGSYLYADEVIGWLPIPRPDICRHRQDGGMVGNQVWRRSGRTTRQADAYIQKLFACGTVRIADHYSFDPGRNKHTAEDMNERLLRIILDRLKREHPSLFSAGERAVLVDMAECTITLPT